MPSPIDLLIRAQIPVLMGVFGVPVLLPDGVTIVTGIFDARGDPAPPWGSEVGVLARVSQQVNPMVQLREEVASALVEQALITIEGDRYRIVRMDPDGAGLVRIELMLERVDPDAPPDTARWQ